MANEAQLDGGRYRYYSSLTLLEVAVLIAVKVVDRACMAHKYATDGASNGRHSRRAFSVRAE